MMGEDGLENGAGFPIRNFAIGPASRG